MTARSNSIFFTFFKNWSIRNIFFCKEAMWIPLMDITISKPWATVFLFGNARCLQISPENCWISGKLFENLLTDYHKVQTTIIFGIPGTSGRNQNICFPSLPLSHKKREGPYDLKIHFTNVQSLLVIKSPLKMCRAYTFKCKCLKGLQTGEIHTTWLQAPLATRPLSPQADLMRAPCPHARTGAVYWEELSK